MRWGHSVLLAALVLAACASEKPAVVLSPPPPASTFLAGSFACTTAQSKPVELAALRNNPARFKDQCIRLPAFSDGRTLLRNAGERGPQPIVLIWKNEDIAARLHRGPSFVDLAGRVRSCAGIGTNAAASATGAQACPVGSNAALYVSAVRIIPTAMD